MERKRAVVTNHDVKRGFGFLAISVEEQFWFHVKNIQSPAGRPEESLVGLWATFDVIPATTPKKFPIAFNIRVEVPAETPKAEGGAQ
jgi:hypothetical protein